MRAAEARLGAGVRGGEPAGLLVVGDIVTDVVARHTTPLTSGTDTAARIRILPGGAGANVACWAARSRGLSAVAPEVRLLGRVGRADSDWHTERLRAAGVRPLLIPDDSAPTATVVVLVDAGAGAERTFLTDSGAALRIGPADWSPSLLDGVGRLHLSGYLLFSESGRRLVRLARESARARGIAVSVDPASAGFIARRGVGSVLAALDGVDLLVPNADEARLLGGAPDPVAAAAALSRRFPLVVVTLGAAGAVVAERGAVTARVPAPAAEAVDSTGAGDAFTGALLAALLSGADPVAAAAEGCRAGAEAVTRTGGRPELADGPAPGPRSAPEAPVLRGAPPVPDGRTAPGRPDGRGAPTGSESGGTAPRLGGEGALPRP
ncbi:carbohydrate kinase family protein [Streptomyces qinzhouensis]|uniref:Sugar kinase n=1 Tax=Streptomyces qinzhouensis TaxID=2599401 RepID=A0A5B8JFL2_9ACTN|nr:PfkB family carbohydrate kinase [Streptomyces qinzhouensis]QDY76233.1 sugar kinase [Streptomyces qinzhouensis]